MSKINKPKDTIDSVDALKSIDQVFVADPRYDGIEIADWHSRVAEITLVETVPKEVKQLFENAKNIALYAYFVYRLHQPAEVIGYTALEKALKLKFEQEKDNIIVKRSPGKLADYMRIALEQGWIKNEGYMTSRSLALFRVEQRKTRELIESGALDQQDSIPVPEAQEHEIIDEMNGMDIAERCLHAGRHIRNALAHGDGGLSPSAIGTLNKIAEEINQLFSVPVCGAINKNGTAITKP